MIEKISNTKTYDLDGVYFEDIDEKVSSKDVCYLITAFKFYYFSTLEAAEEKATSLGIGQLVMDSNPK